MKKKGENGNYCSVKNDEKSEKTENTAKVIIIKKRKINRKYNAVNYNEKKKKWKKNILLS